MLEGAIKALKEHCSNSIHGDRIQHFYRGSDSDTNIPRYSIMTPGGVRRSKNFYDYYNIMIDDSSAARSMDMPRRKESILMATTSALADNYGKVYCVVPFNGTKIAVSNMQDMATDHKFDLHDTNGTLTTSMSQFDGNFWSALNPTPHDESGEAINEILHRLKSKDPTAMAVFHEFFPDPKGDPVKKILDSYDKFVNQHIKVYEAGNVPESSFGRSAEAWFKGTAIIFESSNLEYVQDALKKSS